MLAHFLETIPHDAQTRVVFLAPATETVTAIDSFFHFLHLNDDIREEFDEIVFRKGNLRAEHYSIKRAAKNIRAKILWIHDEEDEMTPLRDALKVKDDNHDHIEFVITKGYGHRRLYRENKVVKQVMDFL